MAEVKLLADSSLATLIDDDATLADAARAAGDYDNGTELDMWMNVYLTVQYDGGPPSAGDMVADLYVLPGDGEGSEVFPDGGDAGLGTDDTPQAIFYVGSFESINPSTSVDETLCIPNVQLHPDGNRFVILNTSGQTFDATWILKGKPVKTQVV